LFGVGFDRYMLDAILDAKLMLYSNNNVNNNIERNKLMVL